MAEPPRRSRASFPCRLCFGIVGVVLMLAGIAKLVDASDLVRAISSVGIRTHVELAATSLIGLELGLGAACVLGLHSRALATATLVTLMVFTAGLIVLRLRSGHSTCGCFGAIFAGAGGESFGFALWRNAMLIGLVAAPGTWEAIKRRASSKTGSQAKAAAPPIITMSVLLLASLYSPTTTAQLSSMYSPWHPHLERPLRTWFTPAIVEEIVERARLDETQAILARHLFTEHQARMLAFREQHEEACGFSRMAEDCEALLKLRGEDRIEALIPLADREAKLESIADAQAALEQRFVDEVRSLLTDSQKEYWPIVLEWLHRRRWLAIGSGYPGDRFDLSSLVEDMKLIESDLVVPPEQFAAVLQSHLSMLDAAIVEQCKFAIKQARGVLRFELRRERANRPMKVYEQGVHVDTVSPDPGFREQVVQNLRTAHELARRVHDCQIRIQNVIIASLVPQRAEEFKSLYYDRVIEQPPPRAKSYIESLLAMEWLDDDRRDALVRLQSNCLARFRLYAIESHEIAERQAEIRYSNDEIRSANDPGLLESAALTLRINALGSRRAQDDDRTMKEALAMFTVDEHALLPPAPFWSK